MVHVCICSGVGNYRKRSRVAIERDGDHSDGEKQGQKGGMGDDQLTFDQEIKSRLLVVWIASWIYGVDARLVDVGQRRSGRTGKMSTARGR